MAAPPPFALLSATLAEGAWADLDWVALGLVLSIAGSFLLANAILLRHPRELVAEHFGQRRQRLGSIRGYVFHRVQVALGFTLLLGGFGLQLIGRYASTPPLATAPLATAGGAPGAIEPATQFPIGWVGLLIVVVGLLQLGGWWISQRLFRRYVREYLVERESELETDSKLAREVGELFGLEMLPEDTVQSYVARLRERLDLPRENRGSERRPGAMPRAVEDPSSA